jgi:hypothetical protein
MDRGRPIQGGTTSYYRRRIWDLCASGNLVSPANKGGCARGNIITGEHISYAPAIVMLAISKSLLVLAESRMAMLPNHITREGPEKISYSWRGKSHLGYPCHTA